MLRLYLSCKKNESDINETIDASASNTESENARAVESKSQHASAYETAWAETSPQGTSLMKTTLQDNAYPENKNEVTNKPTSASVSWDSVTELDMGQEEDVIIVTQASVSDDEEMVIGGAYLCDGFHDLDDTLPMDPGQVERVY